jgi:hypothetical protein
LIGSRAAFLTVAARHSSGVSESQARKFTKGFRMALRIGTSEHGGTFFTQGTALAELFNRGRPENDRCEV